MSNHNDRIYFEPQGEDFFMTEKQKKQESKELDTILVIVLALVALYWFRRRNVLLLEIALGLGAVSLVLPAFRQGLHRAWMTLAKGMGAVSGRVLLTVVYVLVLVPLSFFARLSGKVTLRLKPGGPSYFKERDHTYTKEDMSHPW
jgi:hypothetical protein